MIPGARSNLPSSAPQPANSDLRKHQADALAAFDRIERVRRTWVDLPPGSGKTRVGLEIAQRLVSRGQRRVDKVLVLGPNTAIVGQWLRSATAFGFDTGADRDLSHQLTALTYQSLAIFDAEDHIDSTTDDAKGEESELLSRLHANGRELIETMRGSGRLLLILDECHHLLEVWGRLLGEVLDQVPRAVVVGLTATPPGVLTPAQRELTAELLGEPFYSASIPAVVREGDLAPYAELVWLTQPTSTESDWLNEQASRFKELVAQLTDPSFGTTPFFEWIDKRFLAHPQGWRAIEKRDQELAAGVLRLHHEGLIALPEGARMLEEHRQASTADDWVGLIEDWLLNSLHASGDEDDQQVVELVRAALPSVGYAWTRKGIRRGRSTVDRVLARSASKPIAATEITRIEYDILGDRLRLLVLCDHERAGATLPADLVGVLDPQSGSAMGVLQAMLDDPATALLNPLMVTGSSVAGSIDSLSQLRDSLGETWADLTIEPWHGTVHRLVGRWTSRAWVPAVTRHFAAGNSMVLIGTRALLGEGWDAPFITGLIDLTSATTSTAIVQTRGRALRVDPNHPDKVAINWTVTCVASEHPRGLNDWQRLVRKHTGFYGVDQAGDIIDGVAHLDDEFSAHTAPDAANFDAINARMITRSQQRAQIAASWRVGEAYEDTATRTIRIAVPRSGGSRLAVIGQPKDLIARVVPGKDNADRASLVVQNAPASAQGRVSWLLGGATLALILGIILPGAVPLVAGIVTYFVLFGAGLHAIRKSKVTGRAVLEAARQPPTVVDVARAVADALFNAKLIDEGAPGVVVNIAPDGEYRCRLEGVTEAESAIFAEALDEALAPLDQPRYVVPRWIPATGADSSRAASKAAAGIVENPIEQWFPVPTVLGVNQTRAQHYAKAWATWVSGASGPMTEALFTGSPEGAGVLTAFRGSDPFEATTVIRRQWEG